MAISLLPDNPGAWTYHRYQDLYAIPREQREKLQLEAVQLNFARMRDRIPALKKLADRQGVERIDKLEDVLPVCFDHRVLKNYPIQIIENRDFPRLTSWLNKLTAHDLTRVDLSGITTIEEWLARLEAFGMLVTYSSGTTGKLSFVPRSLDEFGPWRAHYFNVNHACSGVNPHTTKLPTFFPGYRGGYQTMLKMMSLFNVEMAGGPQHYHTLYDTHIPADLMALSGRMQSAEDKGEIGRLGLDPALLEQRRTMLEQGRRKDQDLGAWFSKMIEQFKGQRVKIGGTFSDLYRVAKAGLDKGKRCEFAPGSVMIGGGGMKGYKDAPADWEDQVKHFFGVKKLGNQYGFSENIGNAPLCEGRLLSLSALYGASAHGSGRQGHAARRGAEGPLSAGRSDPNLLLGRLCLGRRGYHALGGRLHLRLARARARKTIRRFSEGEGGDDKITCAGSQQAYNEFMEFVAGEYK
jgi:hypothetical protein